MTETVFSLDEFMSADASEKSTDSTERIAWLEYALKGVYTMICPQENALFIVPNPHQNQNKLIKVPLDEPEQKEEKILELNNEGVGLFSNSITIELHENDTIILPGYNFSTNQNDSNADDLPLHVYDSIYIIGAPAAYREHGLFYSDLNGNICYSPKYRCIDVEVDVSGGRFR